MNLSYFQFHKAKREDQTKNISIFNRIPTHLPLIPVPIPYPTHPDDSQRIQPIISPRRISNYLLLKAESECADPFFLFPTVAGENTASDRPPLS